MIVVSDASPIIGLSAVGALDLLRQLYGQIIVPEVVLREVERGGLERPGGSELRSADWIVVRSAGRSSLTAALTGELDLGEAEALALAIEISADLVLIDERRARLVAQRLGLPVVGVLGVLVEAKAKGLLPVVAPLLDALESTAGFRLSPALHRHVLEVCSEKPE